MSQFCPDWSKNCEKNFTEKMSVNLQLWQDLIEVNSDPCRRIECTYEEKRIKSYR